MATTITIVNGPVTIDDVDYSDAITKVILHAVADEVEIPARLSQPKSSRKGGVKYSIELEYLSSPGTDQLAEALDVAISADGELPFTAKLTDAATSATNPEYSGTLVVLSNDIGGDAEGLSSSSASFPLTGRWAKATS